MTKQPFKGLKIYYSGSIKGVPEPDPEFPWKLVQFMIKGGAEVLSESVAGRTQEERDTLMGQKTGRMNEIFGHPEPWLAKRDIDTKWVDEATHLVALVNSPSHGVGMEIERALLKPQRGLPFTPILCLTREDLLGNLSNMIRGVKEKGFYLKVYQDLDSATKIIHDFLTLSDFEGNKAWPDGEELIF